MRFTDCSCNWLICVVSSCTYCWLWVLLPICWYILSYLLCRFCEAPSLLTPPSSRLTLPLLAYFSHFLLLFLLLPFFDFSTFDSPFSILITPFTLFTLLLSSWLLLLFWLLLFSFLHRLVFLLLQTVCVSLYPILCVSSSTPTVLRSSCCPSGLLLFSCSLRYLYVHFFTSCSSLHPQSPHHILLIVLWCPCQRPPEFHKHRSEPTTCLLFYTDIPNSPHSILPLLPPLASWEIT